MKQADQPREQCFLLSPVAVGKKGVVQEKNRTKNTPNNAVATGGAYHRMDTNILKLDISRSGPLIYVEDKRGPGGLFNGGRLCCPGEDISGPKWVAEAPTGSSESQ